MIIECIWRNTQSKKLSLKKYITKEFIESNRKLPEETQVHIRYMKMKKHDHIIYLKINKHENRSCPKKHMNHTNYLIATKSQKLSEETHYHTLPEEKHITQITEEKHNHINYL